MSFNVHFYGIESPSRLRRVAIHSVVIGLVLAFYGIWADFIPSAEWFFWGLVLAGTLSIALCFPLISGFASGRIEFRQGTSERRKKLFYIVLPPVLFAMIFLAIIHGTGAALTKFFGTRASIEVVATKKHLRSGRSCDYQLHAPALRKALPSHVCISRSQYEYLATKNAITFLGLRSPLGFVVDSWRLEHSENGTLFSRTLVE